MESPKLSLSSLFGGIPFLDSSFQTIPFLSAVAVGRRHRDIKMNGSSHVLCDYLLPSRATHVYDQMLGRDGFLAGNTLTQNEQYLVDGAISLICNVMPSWTNLLSLPVEVRRIEDSSIIGYSNASRPQIFMLGPIAWHSMRELQEQVLHEMAHIWLYMIEELWNLHEIDNPGFFTLPSGVSGKSGTGVLNASFVAATLCSFYSSTLDGFRDRKLELVDYLSGCLDKLQGYTGLTAVGVELQSRISEALSEFRLS